MVEAILVTAVMTGAVVVLIAIYWQFRRRKIVAPPVPERDRERCRTEARWAPRRERYYTPVDGYQPLPPVVVVENPWMYEGNPAPPDTTGFSGFSGGDSGGGGATDSWDSGCSADSGSSDSGGCDSGSGDF